MLHMNALNLKMQAQNDAYGVDCFSCNQLVNAESCLDVLATIYRIVIYSNSLSICYSPGSVPPYLLVTAQ